MRCFAQASWRRPWFGASQCELRDWRRAQIDVIGVMSGLLCIGSGCEVSWELRAGNVMLPDSFNSTGKEGTRPRAPSHSRCRASPTASLAYGVSPGADPGCATGGGELDGVCGKIGGTTLAAGATGLIGGNPVQGLALSQRPIREVAHRAIRWSSGLGCL